MAISLRRSVAYKLLIHSRVFRATITILAENNTRQLAVFAAEPRFSSPLSVPCRHSDFAHACFPFPADASTTSSLEAPGIPQSPGGQKLPPNPP